MGVPLVGHMVVLQHVAVGAEEHPVNSWRHFHQGTVMGHVIYLAVGEHTTLSI